MRERHNIVGSEVGRARPPVYFKAPVVRRAGRGRGWALLVVVLLAILVTGGVATLLDQQGLQTAGAGSPVAEPSVQAFP